MKIKNPQALYTHQKAKEVARTLQLEDDEWKYIAIEVSDKYSRIEVIDEDGIVIETHFGIV